MIAKASIFMVFTLNKHIASRMTQLLTEHLGKEPGCATQHSLFKKSPEPEPRDCHDECSKSEKGRQMPYDLTYMWNLKNVVQMNLFTKQ